MNYCEIKDCDIANGPGVRVSLFVSGCTHHCKGCFNPQTWDFSFGKLFDEETQRQLLLLLSHEYISGLTLLGGEPLEDVNRRGLLPFIRKVKAAYPEKTIWCYSGYTFETDILGRMCSEDADTKELISYIDVLVDGEFILEKKNISLKFRGSENQRIIDVRKSLASGKTVLLRI